MQLLDLTASFRHLLATTEQLIKEKGCKQTTLQDIIERSGFSKGAIYHYVRSKDELFGFLLRIKMEETNKKFQQAKDEKKASLEAPLSAIASTFKYLTDEKDITNQIFIYLLGRKDQPAISKVLSKVHEHSKELSISWIEEGQRAGVIPESLDAQKTAIKFMTFAYGLRVMAMVHEGNHMLSMQDYYDFMFGILRRS